jgi:hypothetical protein
MAVENYRAVPILANGNSRHAPCPPAGPAGRRHRATNTRCANADEQSPRATWRQFNFSPPRHQDTKFHAKSATDERGLSRRNEVKAELTLISLVREFGCAALIATHDSRLHPVADRVCNLKEGKIYD